MKKKKNLSSIMVSVSAFAFSSLTATPVFAQIVINCTAGINIGKNAQCSDTAKLVINPDGSTNLTAGCMLTTGPYQPGRCTVSTGGVPVSKSVRVDFGNTAVNIKNGAKFVRIDNFKMQYKLTVPAASKFTFTPTEIANTINLSIGGTVNTTAGQGLGTYTGNLIIRANPI